MAHDLMASVAEAVVGAEASVEVAGALAAVALQGGGEIALYPILALRFVC